MAMYEMGDLINARSQEIEKTQERLKRSNERKSAALAHAGNHRFLGIFSRLEANRARNNAQKEEALSARLAELRINSTNGYRVSFGLPGSFVITPGFLGSLSCNGIDMERKTFIQIERKYRESMDLIEGSAEEIAQDRVRPSSVRQSS